MANAVTKVNTIASADIAKINGQDDDDLAKLNTLEFTGVTDAHTLISTHTASTSATIDITSGIDSTYDVYEFHCINIHPANDGVAFSFQGNAYDPSAGTPQLTGFNETITSTAFDFWNSESASAGNKSYNTGNDKAQISDSYQVVAESLANDNDDSGGGILTLYAPSSTTYVKHFTASFTSKYWSNYTYSINTAGYINTQLAITQISFKVASGNMDTGVIKMYGISKS